MKRLVALGMAAAIGATALVGIAPAAQAFDGGPGKKHYKGPHYRSHHNSGPGWAAGAFVAGTIIGLGVAAAATPPPVYAYPVAPYPVAPHPYPAYGGNAHIQWCFATYPNSYNPQTNTWVGYNGVAYYCNSPYDSAPGY